MALPHLSSHSTASISRNALIIIAVILSGAALRWMTDIITPLLLAMFLGVMVDGFSRVIHAHLPRLPAWVALSLAILISVLLFLLSACLLYTSRCV